MTEPERRNLVRLVALRLLQNDVPGAPAAAIGPPSKWWYLADDLVEYIVPYVRQTMK